MELEPKQKVIVVLVLLFLAVVGFVMAFTFIYLDLLVPSKPTFDIPTLDTTVDKLNELAPKLEELLPKIQSLVDRVAPEEIDTLVNYIVSQLAGAGVVNEGPLKPFDVSKCLTGEVPTCFYQNPATPYTRFAWKNELPGLLADLDVIPYQPRDVLVIKGITPPPCVYWSFVPYYLQGPDVCLGEQVGAGLSDSVSNITTGWAPSTPFIVIMGANSGAIAAVKSKILESGQAPTQIATQQFAYVGRGLYWFIGRTTLFDSEVQREEYLANTRIGAAIIRVPENTFDTSLTLTVPTYKPRNTAIDENTLIGTTTHYLAAEEYLQSVLDTLGGTYTAQEVPVVQAPVLPSGDYDSGASCIAECGNCFEDNRDTVYYAGEVENFAPGYYLLVYAVNHSAYQKAIYAQISVSDNTKQLGLDAVNALPSDGDFYKVLVSQTTDAPTVVLPGGTQTLTIADTVTDVSIAERAYVQPTTPNNPSFGVSADPSTLIPMKVWLLSP